MGTVATGSFVLLPVGLVLDIIEIKSDDAPGIAILQQKPFEILDSGCPEQEQVQEQEQAK